MAEYQLHCFAQSGNAYRAALMLNLIGADWQPCSSTSSAKACSARRNGAAASTRGVPGLGRHQSAAPRPRHVQVFGADPGRIRRSGAAAVLRARQDLCRRQGRHPARARSGRVRLRHPEFDEGRIQRGRRSRHRPLLDAPAARRRRRHHAVQFPGHDPAVEMRPGDRLRQLLHPQAVGARSVGADAHRRIVPQSRIAAGRAQCRQRRQGGGRHACSPTRA